MKIRARNRAYHALRIGELTRQPCETCGTLEGVEMHHPDYSKPLKVRWFCQPHHREHEAMV